MKIPNLIHINNGKPISDSFFKDMEIDKLLSANDILFLKFTCYEEEIKLRQGIFRAMENERFCVGIKNCQDSINDYQKIQLLSKNPNNKLEQYYYRVQLLEKCVTVCRNFQSLYGYCEAVDNVVKYFVSEIYKEQEMAIVQKINEIKEITLKISNFCISFAKKNFIQKDLTLISYADKIDKCGQVLGFSPLSHKTATVSLDEILSDAYIMLYQNEILLLEEIENYCCHQFNFDFSNIKAEIDFIINIWSLIEKATTHGIPHVFPHISPDKEIHIQNLYSYSLLNRRENIIPNDVKFDKHNSFWFVTGANGGGKTEFLKTLGTNLLFFLAGCPVLADSAYIYPFSFLASHFPKDERFDKIGRLEEEKNRTDDILLMSDSNSFLLFNEPFSATDEQCGLKLLLNLASHMKNNNIFGIVVTHFADVDTGEYAIMSPEVIEVSEDKHIRTYRIVEKFSTTSSYAKDIIYKYKLDRKSLRIRKGMLNG